MDKKQAAETARVETKVAAPQERVDSEPMASRSLTASAMQMVAQAAELAGAGVVIGAAHQTGRRLVDQAFDRPDEPPPPKIEVEHGYRPKSVE